ncbi:MAG: NADH-quinone oxidoreductase subunit C [Eggerthellaceae bacterium]|nr:NADH-quinone oxidoreductase subunit C [Eggerthellaceae bacterium]
MAFQTEFTVIPLSELKACAQARKAEGSRYVQTLAVNTEAGVDIVYSFMLGDRMSNYKLVAVKESDVVPSITDEFLAAFIWENEIHDLFGITFEGISIDFGGKFYNVAVDKPMTVISPAQLAAREKAAKLAAAKAAKEKAGAPAASVDAELEAKLAGMDPEKAAKVRAAMEAKAKKEAARAAEQKGGE